MNGLVEHCPTNWLTHPGTTPTGSQHTQPLLSNGQICSATGPFASRIYNSETVPSTHRYTDELPKSSTCTLELDMPVQSILNRSKIEQRPLHHEFIERLHPSQTPGEAKLVHALRELWDDEHRRRKAQGRPPPLTAPKGMYGPERDHDKYSPEDKHWRETELLEPKLDERAAESLAHFRRAMGLPAKEATYDSWVGDYYSMRAREAGYTDSSGYKYWLSQIRTAFEQTDAIFDQRLVLDEQEAYPFGAWAVRGVGIKTWDPPPLGSTQAPVERTVDILAPEDQASDDDIDMEILQATQSRIRSEVTASQAGYRDDGLEGWSDEDGIDERAIKAAQAEEDDDDRQVRQSERSKLFPQGDEEDNYWDMDDGQEYTLNHLDAEAETGPKADQLLEAAAESRSAGQAESVTPQKRQTCNLQAVSNVTNPDFRPTKQIKPSNPSSHASLQPAQPAAASHSPSPGPSPRKRNPFASPQRKLRVDTPHNPLAATPRLRHYPSVLDERDSIGVDHVPSGARSNSSYPATSPIDRPAGDQTQEMTVEDVVRALETELGDGFLDEDVELTPTQVDPAPHLVRLDHREKADYEMPGSPMTDDINVPDLAQPLLASARKRVKFNLPDLSPAQSPPQSAQSRFGPSPTPTLPSSGKQSRSSPDATSFTDPETRLHQPSDFRRPGLDRPTHSPPTRSRGRSQPRPRPS